MASDNFIKIFGNVVEHYPAAAIGILKNRPFDSPEDIANAIEVYLETLSLNGKICAFICFIYIIQNAVSTEQEKILQLHPDLAGKLAELGKLTKESTQEQISAGLDKLSTEEKQKLSDLNER